MFELSEGGGFDPQLYLEPPSKVVSKYSGGVRSNPPVQAAIFYQLCWCNYFIIISPYSVAFGVILSLLFFFVCTVEDISTQDGAIVVKIWLRVEQTPGTGTR